jgi:hypothetical protein
MLRVQKLLIPAYASLTLLATFGCDSDNSSDHSRTSRDRISERRVDKDTYYDRDVRVDRTRDRDYDRIGRDTRLDDRDATLGSARLSGIPRNARRVDSAPGTTEMAYDARRDATVYVYDVDSDKIVYTGSLRSGDRFILDANDNIALINGKKVLDKDLKSRHVFRLYVLDDRARSRELY